MRDEATRIDRRRVALAWALAAAVALLAPLPLSLTELVDETSAGLPLDKLAHVVLFALLGRAWLAAAARGRDGRVLSVALAAIAYGGLLEFLQPLVAARSTELLDLAANALGVTLAAALEKMGTGTLFREASPD